MTTPPRRLAALCALVGLTLAGCAAESGSNAAAPATDTADSDAGAAADATGSQDASADSGPDGSNAGGGAGSADAAITDAGSSGDTHTTGDNDAAQTTNDATDAGAQGDPDASPTGAWGPEHCTTAGAGSGYGVGQQITSLPIFDCDTGAQRDFAEVCGADATWLFVAHSHCPTCKATAQYTPTVSKQFAAKDVAIVHVVYIDDGQSCPSWRAKYGLDKLPNMKVYLDKTGAAWNLIKTKNYTAPHAIMTKDRVVTFKAHGLSSGGVAAQLTKALAP